MRQNVSKGPNEEICRLPSWVSSQESKAIGKCEAIGIMITTSILDCYDLEGTEDGDVFYNFLQSSFLLQSMPLNATNGICDIALWLGQYHDSPVVQLTTAGTWPSGQT